MAGYISKFATGATIEAILDKANNSQSVSAAEKTAWNNKQNALTFDTIPTENSTNPVTSGGLYNMQSTLETEIASKATIDSIYGLGISLVLGADLNDYTTPGIYQCPTTAIAGTLTNSPVSATNTFRLEVKAVNASNRFMQTLYPLSGGEYYTRNYTSSGWQPWYKFAGEAVT